MILDIFVYLCEEKNLQNYLTIYSWRWFVQKSNVCVADENK